MKTIRLLAFLLLALPMMSACGAQGEEAKEIELVYVVWDSEIASNHVVKIALEQAGYDVTLTSVEQGIMWSSVADGSADAHVAGWLPEDMKVHYEQHKDDIIDLGANLEGAQTGLAVPAYMEIDSIEELSADVVSTITGIDAGAGVMMTTEEALREYGMDDVTLSASSDAIMTAELGNRYAAQEPIVITAWQPHWKFNSYDLKFLEDSKGIYEANGEIRTIVRAGLAEEKPEAYRILDQFYWTADDMNEVMLYMAKDGMEPEEAAEKWVNANQDKVDEWLKGV